jgi:hypothetical protein
VQYEVEALLPLHFWFEDPNLFHVLETIMRTVIATIVLLSTPSLVDAQALNMKDMPDEVRALVLKEMSRKNLVKQEQQDTNRLEKKGAETDESEEETYGRRGASGKKSGCKMDVGSSDTPSRGQRKVTTVVTAPIVQICK